MKKLILMSIGIICLNMLNAQINVPQDTGRVYLSDIYTPIATVNEWQLQSVQNDSVMYTTNEKPFFITVDQVNNYIKANADIYTTPKYIGLIYYEPLRDIQYKILRSGKVILEQRIKRSKLTLVNKSKSQSVWYYLRYAKINNYPANALWNYEPLDSIINPKIEIIATDTVK